MGKRGEESAGQQVQGRVYMDSNSSMRCLVLPCRIWRRVLYLSRPRRMFSAWIMSLAVFFVSSRAFASSEERAFGGGETDSNRLVETQSWTRRFPADSPTDPVSIDRKQTSRSVFLWATCSSWPCLSKEVGSDYLMEVHPTQSDLWFCGSC